MYNYKIVLGSEDIQINHEYIIVNIMSVFGFVHIHTQVFVHVCIHVCIHVCV